MEITVITHSAKRFPWRRMVIRQRASGRRFIILYFCPPRRRCDIRLSANGGEEGDVIADKEKIFSSFGVKAVADHWRCGVTLREAHSGFSSTKPVSERSTRWRIDPIRSFVEATFCQPASPSSTSITPEETSSCRFSLFKASELRGLRRVYSSRIIKPRLSLSSSSSGSILTLLWSTQPEESNWVQVLCYFSTFRCLYFTWVSVWLLLSTPELSPPHSFTTASLL